MTSIQRYIEKAMEGGWKFRRDYEFNSSQGEDGTLFINERRTPQVVMAQHHEILLDPLAWQAVGKVEGWDERSTWWLNGPNTPDFDRYLFTTENHSPFRSVPNDYVVTPEWHFKMHRMIDALAEGKTVEDYLDTLFPDA